MDRGPFNNGMESENHSVARNELAAESIGDPADENHDPADENRDPADENRDPADENRRVQEYASCEPPSRELPSRVEIVPARGV